MLKWQDPIPPRDWKKCSKCSKTLSFKDKSGWFFMHKEGDHDNPMYFKSLYPASRKTGISVCALRNACEKTNEMITRRKFGPVKYEVFWSGSCSKCIPKPRD